MGIVMEVSKDRNAGLERGFTCISVCQVPTLDNSKIQTLFRAFIGQMGALQQNLKSKREFWAEIFLNFQINTRHRNDKYWKMPLSTASRQVSTHH